MIDGILYLSLLSIVQGITEFLPISSSAHLILLPHLVGVPDQGIAVDMAAHLGSLIAVVLYFKKDTKMLCKGVYDFILSRHTDDRALFANIAIATIPVVIVGFFFADAIASTLRDPRIIAVTSIVFGIALYIADKTSNKLEAMSLRKAWWIGIAQLLALIPGVSRSGITMTAGRVFGFSRVHVARFSLLLSIPTTLAAIILISNDVIINGSSVSIATLLYVTILTSIVAYLSIASLLEIISRFSFTPFVIYRVFLGIILLIIFW